MSLLLALNRHDRPRCRCRLAEVKRTSQRRAGQAARRDRPRCGSRLPTRRGRAGICRDCRTHAAPSPPAVTCPAARSLRDVAAELGKTRFCPRTRRGVLAVGHRIDAVAVAPRDVGRNRNGPSDPTGGPLVARRLRIYPSPHRLKGGPKSATTGDQEFARSFSRCDSRWLQGPKVSL
jgi:hypothetical protein